MNYLHEKYNNPKVLIYDLETFPNIFTAAFENAATGKRLIFEISDRANQLDSLLTFLDELKQHSCWMVGFGNEGFDYPILHMIMQHRTFCTLADIYSTAQKIIDTPFRRRWVNIISNPYIKQIDLYKINHYDNVSKSTSLKTLEMNMVMDSVEELPFPPGSVLTPSQMDTLIEYNWHDVDATRWFFMRNLDQIQLRGDLTKEYGIDMTNFSDSKIGSEIMSHELTKAGIQLTEPGSKEKKQTKRDFIPLKDCILQTVKFEHPEFNKILDYLKSKTVTETKGVFKNLTADVDGLKYVFGSGGLHASVEREKFIADQDHIIRDSDVVSYYPSLAIKNKFYPDHLSVKFCEVYEEMFKKRRSFKKGTAQNAALKIALNATYGNSNSKYSNLYDPMFTMKITLNGQFLLAMLCEQLLKTPGLKIIAVNTDGVCYIFNKQYDNQVKSICNWWQNLTQLTLEHEEYTKVFAVDVNNYISL